MNRDKTLYSFQLKVCSLTTPNFPTTQQWTLRRRPTRKQCSLWSWSHLFYTCYWALCRAAILCTLSCSVVVSKRDCRRAHLLAITFRHSGMQRRENPSQRLHQTAMCWRGGDPDRVDATARRRRAPETFVESLDVCHRDDDVLSVARPKRRNSKRNCTRKIANAPNRSASKGLL